jgi:hypothetical protein
VELYLRYRIGRQVFVTAAVWRTAEPVETARLPTQGPASKY